MAKKATKTKKKTTALARLGDKRPVTDAIQVRVNDPSGLLQPGVMTIDPSAGMLGDHPSIGQLGLVEVRLTEKEELELSAKVSDLDVLIKPTGQPYLPHRIYTAWFNRAFGRLGWAIVPRALPTKAQLVKDANDAKNRQLVLVPYALHVHGLPVAFAWGEQEYSESNAEQTYGDAVEATVANALRRCAKRLGVGLELWDRDWLEAWKARYAVQVTVKGYGGGKNFKRWRRRVDPPIPFEIGGRSQADDDGPDDHMLPAIQFVPGDESQRVPRPRPAAGNDGTGDDKITKPQRQRMAVIARKAGREDAEVRLWLKKRWNANSSADILRKDYDQVCRELEARGSLQMPGDGEVRS